MRLSGNPLLINASFLQALLFTTWDTVVSQIYHCKLTGTGKAEFKHSVISNVTKAI